MIKKILIYIDSIFSMKVLLKIIAVFTILFLLMKTDTVWGNWISLLKSIAQPFLIGFILAYIMYPFIQFLVRKGVPQNLAIIFLWVVIILLMALLFVQLLPILYEKVNDFISSIIEGIRWVGDKVGAYGEYNGLFNIQDFTDSLVKTIQPNDQWLPNIVSGLPGFMTSFLDFLTNSLFSIIIAIYMLFDFPKIKRGIARFFAIFHKDSELYLRHIDSDVSVYLKSLLLLMLIKFIEYSAFYFVVGHQDWLIVGILAAVGLWIPYLGGTIANVVGILTALSLAPSRIFILIIGICVLANIDAYLISPMIHEKRSDLGPLLTLFAVFAGGVLYGAIGIMISIPIAIILKSIHEVYLESHKNESI